MTALFFVLNFFIFLSVQEMFDVEATSRVFASDGVVAALLSAGSPAVDSTVPPPRPLSGAWWTSRNVVSLASMSEKCLSRSWVGAAGGPLFGSEQVGHRRANNRGSLRALLQSRFWHVFRA